MPTIDIATYRAPWDEKVSVVASVGLSFFTEERGERAEVILLVDDEIKAAEHAMARIVGLLAENPRAFAIGEFYEGPKSFGPIARRHGKIAMVLAARPFQEPPLFHVDCDGEAGHVFVLVPITAAERDVLTTDGWPALEARLDGADVSSLSRASVV